MDTQIRTMQAGSESCHHLAQIGDSPYAALRGGVGLLHGIAQPLLQLILQVVHCPGPAQQTQVTLASPSKRASDIVRVSCVPESKSKPNMESSSASGCLALGAGLGMAPPMVALDLNAAPRSRYRSLNRIEILAGDHICCLSSNSIKTSRAIFERGSGLEMKRGLLLPTASIQYRIESVPSGPVLLLIIQVLPLTAAGLRPGHIRVHRAFIMTITSLCPQEAIVKRLEAEVQVRRSS